MNQSQPTRWEALTEVARRCVGEKQFDKAEEAYLAALREAEQFGDTDPRVSATLNALARVYHRRSKFFPAAALLHRLLGIKEREHGDEHPELAGILNNLAEMYSRLGDARQELELRERALHIRTKAGETEGAPLAGLRERIGELTQKLAEERAREEAARNAPRRRIPVPTGATDLPLILPTPVASPQLPAMSAAFAPTRKAEPAAPPTPRATAPAPAPVRKPLRAPTPVTEPPFVEASIAPAPEVPRMATPVAPPSRPTPATPAFDPRWKPSAPPTPEESLDAVTPASPLSSVAPVAPATPVTSPTATTAWGPLATTPPNAARPPVASPSGAFTPIAPLVESPESAFTPIAPPAPDSTLLPMPSPAAGPAWKPIAPPAPDTKWKPLAPPAPVSAWPDRTAGESTADTAEPDDYDAPIDFRPRRNFRPLVFGVLGVAGVAAAAAAAFVIFGRSGTTEQPSRALAAQQPSAVEAAVPEPPAPTPAEQAALQAGLANLQQEDQALPGEPAARRGGAIGDAAIGAPGSSNADSAPGTRLRVSMPSLVIDNVTKTIEDAARARVDSLTQAGDKQVYEYSGKKPRQ